MMRMLGLLRPTPALTWSTQLDFVGPRVATSVWGWALLVVGLCVALHVADQAHGVQQALVSEQASLSRLQRAQHQRQVGFAGFAFAELVLQVCERTALFGHQQDARGFAVQPVYQFQKFGLRAGLAQLLDHAKADAAAAMHGHASRFVDGHQVLVVEQQRKLARGRRVRGFLGHFFRHAHGRQAHLIAAVHAGVGTGTAFVDAHFTAADDAVDVRFGHALELAHEEIVEALALGFGIDFDEPCRRGSGGHSGLEGGGVRCFAAYNLFHLRSVL